MQPHLVYRIQLLAIVFDNLDANCFREVFESGL